jgi:predicted RNA-binding protein YlqC (UPF0109 family)
MKEFVEFIAKNLVDQPTLVDVQIEERENKVILRLKVGDQDVGKVIGRQGRTAHAMRTLVGAIAAKVGKKAILEIAD